MSPICPNCTPPSPWLFIWNGWIDGYDVRKDGVEVGHVRPNVFLDKHRFEVKPGTEVTVEELRETFNRLVG